MKTIQFREGIVSFEIPEHWCEDRDAAGSARFYDESQDLGTMRLNVLSFPRDRDVPEERVLKAAFGGKAFERLANGLPLCYFVAQEDEGGERLDVHRWDVLVAASAKEWRLICFGYTALASQSKEASTIEEFRAVDQAVRNARFFEGVRRFTVTALHYPKIPGSKNCPDTACIAFEKYDGTNLHWDWDREFGWHSFGTRRDAFNLTDAGIAQFAKQHAHLAQAVTVFQSTLAEPVAAIFKDHSRYAAFPSLKIFTEFFGPHSFAGLHREDEAKQLRLFDVWADPLGMIGPEQFVADFAALPIPRIVYRGKLTGQFSDDVRRGKYGVAEGVVCKGGGAGGKDLWMVKIKTDAYMARLKTAFAERWEDYWE